MKDKILKNLQAIKKVVEASYDKKQAGGVLGAQLEYIDALITQTTNEQNQEKLYAISQKIGHIKSSELIETLTSLRDTKFLINSNRSLLGPEEQYKADLVTLTTQIEKADINELKKIGINVDIIKKSIQIKLLDVMLKNLRTTLTTEAKPHQQASTAGQQTTLMGFLKDIATQTTTAETPSREKQLINKLERYQEALSKKQEHITTHAMSELLREYRVLNDYHRVSRTLSETYGHIPKAEINLPAQSTPRPKEHGKKHKKPKQVKEAKIDTPAKEETFSQLQDQHKALASAIVAEENAIDKIVEIIPEAVLLKKLSDKDSSIVKSVAAESEAIAKLRAEPISNSLDQVQSQHRNLERKMFEVNSAIYQAMYLVNPEGKPINELQENESKKLHELQELQKSHENLKEKVAAESEAIGNIIIDSSISVEFLERERNQLTNEIDSIIDKTKSKLRGVQQSIEQNKQEMPDLALSEDPLIKAQQNKINRFDESIKALMEGLRQFRAEVTPLLQPSSMGRDKFSEVWAKYAKKGETFNNIVRVYEILIEKEREFLEKIKPYETALTKAANKITVRVREIEELQVLSKLRREYTEVEEQYKLMLAAIEPTVQHLRPVEKHLLNKNPIEEASSAAEPQQQSVQSQITEWVSQTAESVVQTITTAVGLTQESPSKAQPATSTPAENFEQKVKLGKDKLLETLSSSLKQYGSLLDEFNQAKKEAVSKINTLSSEAMVREHLEKNLLKGKIEATRKALENLGKIKTPLVDAGARIEQEIITTENARIGYAAMKKGELDTKFGELDALYTRLAGSAYAENDDINNDIAEWKSIKKATTAAAVNDITAKFPKMSIGKIEKRATTRATELDNIERDLKEKIEKVNSSFLADWNAAERAIDNLNTPQANLPPELFSNSDLTNRLKKITKPNPLDAVCALNNSELTKLGEEIDERYALIAKVSKVANTRKKSPEVSYVNQLLEEVGAQLEGVSEEDAKYPILNGLKTDLEGKLSDYNLLKDNIEGFIGECLITLSSYLSPENLQMLTNEDRKSFVNWVSQIIDIIVTALISILPDNKPQAYRPQFFANRAEKQIATAAQKAHEQLEGLKDKLQDELQEQPQANVQDETVSLTSY